MPLSPSNIRSQGYGLNYNRGFGTGRVLTGQVSDPELARTSMGAYQQRLGGQQAHQQGLERMRAQQGFDRDSLNLQLAQQDREGGRRSADHAAGLANQANIARMQTEAGKLPTLLKQARWNQVFPWVQGQLNNLGNWNSGYQGAGQQGQQPAISDAPIYSQQLIEQQVNQTRATNDQATAQRQAKLGQDLAGRGFGSRSPLAMMMGEAMQMQNLAGNTQAEQGLRWDAAGGNAKHVLEAQKAREAQFANRQQEEIERGKTTKGLLGQIFASLLSSV